MVVDNLTLRWYTDTLLLPYPLELSIGARGFLAAAAHGDWEGNIDHIFLYLHAADVDHIFRIDNLGPDVENFGENVNFRLIRPYRLLVNAY